MQYDSADKRLLGKTLQKKLAEEDKLKQEFAEDVSKNLNEWPNMILDYFQPCLLLNPCSKTN